MGIAAGGETKIQAHGVGSTTATRGTSRWYSSNYRRDDSIDMGVVYADCQAFLEQVQQMGVQQDEVPWCAICHAELDAITDNNPEGSTIVTLTCGHEFHQRCVDNWTGICIERNSDLACPTCLSRTHPGRFNQDQSIRKDHPS